LQHQNKNGWSRGQSPLEEIGMPDDKEFFKLTRYQFHKRLPSSNDNLAANPESNDYAKPIPLHNYVNVNLKLIDKRLLIECLEKKYC
jgi:hypothetical protein